MTAPALSIIIPASNEASNIGRCLDALITQTGVNDPVEVIVVANGCHDDTAEVAARWSTSFSGRGWGLTVLDLAQGGKVGALNAGDAAANSASRLYLDADIQCGEGLLAGLLDALKPEHPVYAGAQLMVERPRSLVSRHYARFWQRLPFIARGVSGAGLFAVNAPARSRWTQFPQIIADDAYVRALFSPTERVLIPSTYQWPISEGFTALARVRRRQDDGVRELRAKFPELTRNVEDSPTRSEIRRLALSDPIGFMTYVTVSLATRMRKRQTDWARNR